MDILDSQNFEVKISTGDTEYNGTIHIEEEQIIECPSNLENYNNHIIFQNIFLVEGDKYSQLHVHFSMQEQTENPKTTTIQYIIDNLSNSNTDTPAKCLQGKASLTLNTDSIANILSNDGESFEISFTKLQTKESNHIVEESSSETETKTDLNTSTQIPSEEKKEDSEKSNSTSDEDKDQESHEDEEDEEDDDDLEVNDLTESIPSILG